MSQNPVGQTESKTDLLKQITNKVDEIEKKYGIHYILMSEDIEEIFSLDDSKLDKLSNDEINRYLYILAQYNIYIQRNTNRCRAIINYLNAKLKMIIAREYKNYMVVYVPADVVKDSVIAGNTYANHVYELIQNYSLELESLFDISSRVLQLSNALKNMTYSRNSYVSH